MKLSGMEEKDKIVCFKCNVELTALNTFFTYLNSTFSAEILRCPECGQVYITEELAETKIAKAEELLEDK